MAVADRPPPSPIPAPLREAPPADRFCDIVLNGGVASGVVYPWALLELAREYRFKSIGGNSVGAMAAVLAAAAEYGRCRGDADAFEPLRRLPHDLAETDGDARRRTTMERLFVPHASLRRPFELFIELCGDRSRPGQPPRRVPWWRAVPRAYGLPPLLLGLGIAGILAVALAATWEARIAVGAVALLALVMGPLVVLAARVWNDLKALSRHGYGLCSGKGNGVDEGLVEWLHRGVQLSAGRERSDPPLTFADLWSVPRQGRPGPQPLEGGLQPPDASIDLQLFTSNVTFGRPVRLPMSGENTRLFYDPRQWNRLFPRYLMKALRKASRPYVPASRSDPPRAALLRAGADAKQLSRLRELPVGDLPLVVAARMSMSFPLLFSCVPVWAIDHEGPREKRRPRQALLSDGGLCSNFPVHLFDAAHPRWPTFALKLDEDERHSNRHKVWLPAGHLQGRSERWQRFVPGVDHRRACPLSQLLNLGLGMVTTMKDWNDRCTELLPQVRNRTLRFALSPSEGQLNIAMSRERVLQMAGYGTLGGRALVQRFLPRGDEATAAWRQHLYVRSMIELRALRRHLRNYGLAASGAGHSETLSRTLARATQGRVLMSRKGDGRARCQLDPDQLAGVERAVAAVSSLEAALAALGPALDAYTPRPEPELRLRPPI